MKHPYHLWRVIRATYASSLMLASIALTHAQQALSESDEELVRLSPFEITDNRASPYNAVESLGGARIRRDLIETGASINVITSEFMRDIGASSIIEATMYTSGVTQGPLSGVNGLFNQVFIRGFEVNAVTVDGFTSVGGASPNVPPELLERAETIKGPHSLLVPQGEPGGTSNFVTKNPRFETAGAISYEVADQYFGDKLIVDVTGPLLRDVLAYRIVATDQDSASNIPGRYKTRTLNPMLTWRISPTTQVRLKGFITSWGRTGAIQAGQNNLPIRDDLPHGATVGLADIKPGYEYGGANGAPDWVEGTAKTARGTLELISELGEHLSLKVGAVYRYYHYYSNGGGLSVNRPGATGNRIDPLTGHYTHFQRWQITDDKLPWDRVTNPYFSTPVDYSIAGAVLAENFNQGWDEETTYQADLVGRWEFPLVKVQVVTGASLGRLWNHTKGWTKRDEVLFGQGRTHSGYTPPPLPIPNPLPFDIDLANFTYVNGVPRPIGTVVQTSEGWIEGWVKEQFYVNAHLSLFQDKLLLNGGISQLRVNDKRGGRGENRNLYTLVEGGFTWPPEKAPYKTNPSFSAVYKVTPWLAVYGSIAENSQSGRYYDGNGNTGITRQIWRDGEQTEFGLKMEFFNRRLFVTTAWYDLKQTNINITHPDRNRDPAVPDFSLPDFLFDITNKGIEFDIVGQITPNLNVLASYTDMKLRDQLGRERASAPDRTYNAFLRYGFSRGPVKGLSLSIGMNHVDKQAGENAQGNYTPIGVVIPIGFYQPARTIYNASASYEYGPVRFQLNIDNLFDKETLYQSGGRFGIAAFPERNIRLTTSYSF